MYTNRVCSLNPQIKKINIKIRISFKNPNIAQNQYDKIISVVLKYINLLIFTINKILISKRKKNTHNFYGKPFTIPFTGVSQSLS